MSVAIAQHLTASQHTIFDYDSLEEWGPQAYKYHDCTLKQNVMQLPPDTRVRSIVMDYKEFVIAIWDGKHETVGELVVSVQQLSESTQKRLQDLMVLP